MWPLSASFCSSALKWSLDLIDCPSAWRAPGPVKDWVFRAPWALRAAFFALCLLCVAGERQRRLSFLWAFDANEIRRETSTAARALGLCALQSWPLVRASVLHDAMDYWREDEKL